MSVTKIVLIALLAVFGAFSSIVMLEHGYFGIWEAGLTSGATAQVLADLVIACLLISVWMIKDAREKGRNAWPYVVVTLFAGSFGPLLYLLVGEFGTQRTEARYA